MSAYVIAQIRWDDQDEYKRYIAAFVPLLKRHEGVTLAAQEDRTEVLEGSWPLPGAVVMRFPSKEHVRRWMADPDYPGVVAIRHGAAETNLVMIDGLD
ncbi:MAG: DUF1330 domain-containing protein [Alphaproteobacteria bacterium]|jgi:uncharacterized protein (DUF1330 family)|nr:DUF1330 domain-containing protein [Rhodospirillaceae bacterium]MBT6204215.1 DUF1330 domain-containing protein [Rhodospirillaceae bacterium]MBT6509929.1 DUF1330 domain-containing protein [Rhodospirillaceae bacterium]MBT7613056.1 DUF1330 domain-containing protein [Rhodospirillaceae bacterium]MDG2480649.1 DUF1330 domain-containing protein [Alphaproteobacteria bacterium]